MKTKEKKQLNKKSPIKLSTKITPKAKAEEKTKNLLKRSSFKFKKLNSKKINLNPSGLQKGAMVTIGILTFLTFFLSNLQIFFWLKSDWLVSTVLPAVVAELTNEQRSQFVQKPLIRSSLLDQAAKLKAEDMVKNSYFAHYSPDGVTPWHWFQEVGYTYAYAGENLAVHFNDSKMVVDAWMNSPTHKANIIKNEYTEIGIGTAKGVYEGYDTVFVVQLFGTPAKNTKQNQVAVALEASSDREFLNDNLENSEILGVSRTESGVVVEKEVAESKFAKETEKRAEKDDKPVFVAGLENNNANDGNFSREEEKGNLNTENTFVFEEQKTLETTEQTEATEVAKNTDLFRENIPSDKKEPVFLDTISVVSGLEAETESESEPGENFLTKKKEGSSFYGFLVNPRQILAFVYSVLGILTILALVFSIMLGYKKRNLVEIGFGVALLLVMGGLFFVQYILTGKVLIV